MTLLIDLDGLGDADGALEHLCKASAEGGGDIWSPHPNPLVRRIVEVFTERGLARSAELRKELEAWLGGDRHRPDMVRPNRPPGMMQRWSKAELDLVKTYLEALRPDEFTLEDWLMVVDYLVQRYLPETDLRTEADWLSTRSAMMGKVVAALGDVNEARADVLLAHLPSPDRAGKVLGLSPEAQAAITFGRARACERVVALSDAQRHRLRNIVVDHQEAVHLGDRVGAAESLQSKLLDAEGILNRDWRRIAVTESTEMAGQGFIAAQKPGTKVRRVEVYAGACDFCRSIDGTVMTVADPKADHKDGEKEVWVGKSQDGRAASARKRGPGGLVERDPGERWWVTAGAIHPSCRGSWVKVSAASADPTFDAWLASLKERK